MMKISSIVAIAAAAMLVSIGKADVDFSRDVQPILAEHCFACHGADTSESGLRLDSRETAIQAADSGDPAIVPHDVAASTLLDRIKSHDPDERMPPETEPLTKHEVDVLERWIAEGAGWATHWAYRPLHHERPPMLQGRAWVRTPIDQFVLAGLETDGILPSPEASKEKLIRRLHYDLLGLPPTVDTIHHFVNDSSPDAYERLVDQLMSSPRFGERWGRHWLDKARYADSDGYEKDNNRPNAWRYRDWVIDAINADMPFDQFTIEQLAGDLLPDPTDDQILATAFHRQTLTNTEGGTDQEQWRVAAVMDRTETVGTVWLGLTIGCARCHHHKYDQISQAEYYQLYAFFNNADESNHGLPPTAAQLRQYEKQRDAHQAKLAAKRIELNRKKQLAACGNVGDVPASHDRDEDVKQLADEIEKTRKISSQATEVYSSRSFETHGCPA